MKIAVFSLVSMRCRMREKLAVNLPNTPGILTLFSLSVLV